MTALSRESFACRSPGACRGRQKPRAALLLVALGCLAVLPDLVLAQTVDGLFISVPNPIDDKAVTLIRRKIDDAAKKRNLRKIVFDFNPIGLPAATSTWNSCNALKEYILDLRLKQGITTVAFVQNQVTRHTVLPVIACQQIYFSSALDEEKRFRARLGDVSPDGSDVFNDALVEAYRSAARHHEAPDLVLRLLDRNLELREATLKDGSTHYFSPASIEAERVKGTFDKDLGVPAGLEKGRVLFDTDQARRFGLAHGIARSRADLMSQLKLSPRSLVEDHLADQQVKAALFEVRGKIDKGLLNDLRNQVNSALRDRHNLLIFQLEASGGDTRDIGSFANFLLDLKVNESNTPPRTVAFVPPKVSLGAATFIALGCQEIVMGPDSSLADFAYLAGEERERLATIKDMLLPLVERRGFPSALFEAALTPGMTLYHVRDARDKEERLVTAEAYLADKNSGKPRWEVVPPILEPREGLPLKIPAARAVEWHVAQDIGLPAKTKEDVFAYFGIDPRSVTNSKPGWLYRVAEFFREPAVNFVLIMLGILGLILELKMPGTTVPGVISAICFVLFFWSYSFVGEFTLLASLLFVLGLILLGLEIFIFPGFGFPGIAGIFLIIFSMVLVTLDNIPQTSEDWVQVGSRLLILALGVVGAIVAAFTVAYYLPAIPYASRLVLQPPEDGAEAGEAHSLGPAYARLLGAIGVAATTLRPAGKAQFGDEFYDVVAEGDYVNPGSRVQVIEVEGNRVVVKEIS